MVSCATFLNGLTELPATLTWAYNQSSPPETSSSQCHCNRTNCSQAVQTFPATPAPRHRSSLFWRCPAKPVYMHFLFSTSRRPQIPYSGPHLQNRTLKLIFLAKGPVMHLPSLWPPVLGSKDILKKMPKQEGKSKPIA